MRYPSIDILRTFAIFVMVLVHFGENLSGFHSPITGFGAPLFAFLSGVSYRMWSTELRRRGKSEVDISKISVRRGLFVFGVGIAFNVLVWLPEDTFNWDVLTLVGSALVLLNLVRRIPRSIALVLAACALLVSPLLRLQADYAAYWTNGYFDPDQSLSDVAIGYFATGYFPIFPWIAFSLTGFVVSSRLFTSVSQEKSATKQDGANLSLTAARRAKGFASQSDPQSEPSPWPVVAIGSGLIAAALVLLVVRPYLPHAFGKNYLGGWTMFPPSIEYVTCTLGIALAMLGLTHRYVDCNPRMMQRRGLLEITKTFSRYSFTIYVLHHLVHIWPLWLYAIAKGQEPTYYWMKAMPITASIPLALVFLAVCYVSLRRLGPERNYGIEACMRWLCD
jgi:uncharacterized membrane protein